MVDGLLKLMIFHGYVSLLEGNAATTSNLIAIGKFKDIAGYSTTNWID